MKALKIIATGMAVVDALIAAVDLASGHYIWAIVMTFCSLQMLRVASQEAEIDEA